MNEYLELLRSNTHFRRLWLGAVASFLGDWFNTIALYVLVQRLTGSPLALGAVFITKMLPFALASPLAGLLTDRFDRRRLMIATDLLRAVVVLGFLAVDHASDLPLLYGLITLQVVLGAVFFPARMASIPNITTPNQLAAANVLSAATWSVLLAVGAALGGLVTDWLGVRAVFVLDSLSYCVSAIFIYHTVIPQETDPPAPGSQLAAAVRDIADGWRQMIRRPEIGRIAVAKAAWSLGGGGLVFMLAMLGERLMPAAPAVGIGVLYSVRGIGTGVGPVLARRLVPDERRWPRIIGLGVAATGVGYLAVAAGAWDWWWVALLVGLAHAPSGVNWVFSSVLLQRRTEDRLRGRVLSTQFLLLTLADTLSILVAALLLELRGLELRTTLLAFAAFQILCGLAWTAWAVPAENRQPTS